MAPDPYARYLQQAEELFSAGEVVRAGQIWQAILKQVPDHGPAREGLIRVKAALDTQAASQAAAQAAAQAEAEAARRAEAEAAHRRATDSSVELPAYREPEAALEPAVPAAPAPLPAPEPAPEPPAPQEATAIYVPEPAPAPVAAMDEDTQDKLLREGCTLYDMGQVEDALRKWDQLLAAVPDHAMALQYAQGARRELGLPLDGSVSPAAPASPSHPVTREVPVYGEDEEAADKLLREGCLLYDMGLTEEAVGKWEQALQRAPHRADIQSFLDSAHKDLAQAAAAPAAPAPTAPAPGPSPADEKTSQAEHLMGMQRFEEAAFTFQQALDLDPAHPRAKAGLLRARAAQGAPARPTSTSGSGPIRIEMDRPEPEPEAPPQPEAVQPPEALTKPAPAPRTGLQIKAPEALDVSKLPDWVKDPKLWAATAGGILVLVLGTLWYQSHARDAQLKADVAAAHQAAVSKAARDAQVPVLAETPAGILSEGKQALDEGDAVRAYLRAQTLLKRNPSDGAAAQLLDRAKAALPTGGVVGATAEEYQKHVQTGDLDQAAKVLDGLLRATPDDPALRTQALRLYLRLAEDHASQGRWSDAAEDLARGRALAPEDPAWSARIALLPKIQALPKGDQPLWIALLG